MKIRKLGYYPLVKYFNLTYFFFLKSITFLIAYPPTTASKMAIPPSIGVAGGGGGPWAIAAILIKERNNVKLIFGLYSIFFMVLMSYKFRSVLLFS